LGATKVISGTNTVTNKRIPREELKAKTLIYSLLLRNTKIPFIPCNCESFSTLSKTRLTNMAISEYDKWD
jgi:hypothetical protein